MKILSIVSPLVNFINLWVVGSLIILSYVTFIKLCSLFWKTNNYLYEALNHGDCFLFDYDSTDDLISDEKTHHYKMTFDETLD